MKRATGAASLFDELIVDNFSGGGEPYVITDIGLRMLTPRELARAQGFPDSYILTGTKSSQVARIGNSVCPIMARVLVQANCSDMAAKKRCSREASARPRAWDEGVACGLFVCVFRKW